MSSFYITTAIDYVNNLPHIGTAYEKIGADVLARFHRFLGETVRFQIGSDEHSMNVKKEAEKRGISPKTYCDEMARAFEDIWKKLAISYDYFIQTTSTAHHQSVRKCFEQMLAAGDIYEADYEGWYCESCEAFYMEKDLVEGLCRHHGKKPAWIKEKNLFFRLSRYQDRLLAYIRAHPNFIRPKARENEILQLIHGGLDDISISRSGFDWGIAVPGYPGHVVYVWFDALINYMSGIGYALAPENPQNGMSQWWPASLHVIGKDITRFHCVIWPAMLMSLGLPLPKTVFGHGFVYLKGEKMSKSLGNMVTPLDIVDQWGADSLRYYLLRAGSFGRDGDFTWENFALRYQSDLANGLGNLLSRTLGMLKKYQSGVFIAKASPFFHDIRQKAARVLGEVERALDPNIDDDIDFHQALAAIWELIRDCDRHIDQTAPWALAKAGASDEIAAVLYGVGEGLRVIAVLLSPFLPETSQKVWGQLGLSSLMPWAELTQQALLGEALPDGLLSGELFPLFPRIER